jgi:hypothetical protein
MTTVMKYSLPDITAIMNAGFTCELNPVVLKIINDLAQHVGSPDYVKTPIFTKKVGGGGPKEKENKEVDWKREKQFKATVLETKTGVDAKIDAIRSLLNKLTDKNYMDLRARIMDGIAEIYADFSEQDASKLCTIIFEIASTNRFYSKMYADLFSELIAKYDDFKQVFLTSFANFTVLFDSVEYCDPKADYDRFCKNNKDNEKRKSLSAFFVNLSANGIIDQCEIEALIHRLLFQLNSFLQVENKKNEVDELTENIALLYKKGSNTDLDVEIQKLSTTNVKDNLSFTNKSKFKFMDIV